jgi:hypothetical protein
VNSCIGTVTLGVSSCYERAVRTRSSSICGRIDTNCSDSIGLTISYIIRGSNKSQRLQFSERRDMHLRVIISDKEVCRNAARSRGRECESNRICSKSGSSDKGSSLRSHCLCAIGEVKDFNRRVCLRRSNVAKDPCQILRIRSSCAYRTYRIEATPLTLTVDLKRSKEKRGEE